MSKNLFLNYVQGLTREELLSIIKTEYSTIKGTYELAPCLGVNGCLEFSGALLLWKYAEINLNKNPQEYGSLLIMLMESIGSAFCQMGATEWSNRIDKVINVHDDTLSYDEWSAVYRFLKIEYHSELKNCEFNIGTNDSYKYTGTQFSTQYIDYINKCNSLLSNDEQFNTSVTNAEIMKYFQEKGMVFHHGIRFNIL